jgi:hypothetical protein
MSNYTDKVLQLVNGFNVTSNVVCDLHEFRHADRRDV